jgi:hypothetical protein
MMIIGVDYHPSFPVIRFPGVGILSKEEPSHPLAPPCNSPLQKQTNSEGCSGLYRTIVFCSYGNSSDS